MNTTRKYPWYDSPWLRRYCLAREFLAQTNPRTHDDFVAAMMPLRTRPDFVERHVPGALSAERLQKCRDVLSGLKPSDLELHEAKAFGRWVVHNQPYFDELQSEMTGWVSELAGEALEPCYTFASMYTAMGRCEVHMDAPEAKFTLDMCINQSQPWAIHFSRVVPWPEAGIPVPDWSDAIRTDPELDFRAYALEPGDALLFSGSSQWHYRDPMPDADGRSFCDLLFFHYIPDRMRDLVNVRNWARIFNMPDLDDVLDLDDTRRAQAIAESQAERTKDTI